MKVINKKMCVVFVLVLLEISSLFLMYKSNSNKEIKLDNVENKEVINNNMIAIMIEQSNGSYSEGSWPSDTTYVLNTLKSGCVDNKGNEVKNGMTFNKGTRKILVNTNKTSNCYAYFTRSAKYKVQNNSHVWNSDLTSDGYRFYGSQDETLSTVNNVPNYVCFGTQSKSECVGDTDKYMYRIIGMFQEENGNGTINTSSDYHLKLIKKEALNNKYAWHSNLNANVIWSQSDLYKGLNGNYFLNNPEYYYLQQEFWYSKISNWKWSAAKSPYDEDSDFVFFAISSAQIYLDELNRSNKSNESVTTYDVVTAKIGLQYFSDFMLALGSDTKNYRNYANYSTLKNGWIHLLNNDNATLSTSGIIPPYWNELTIAQSNNFNNKDMAYAIGSNGMLQRANVTTEESVRPTFYLNSDVVICAGTGTSTDPYILG